MMSPNKFFTASSVNNKNNRMMRTVAKIRFRQKQMFVRKSAVVERLASGSEFKKFPLTVITVAM